jgi:hypothetical protein
MSKWWIGQQPFTCRNSRFQTDLKQGSKPHGKAPAIGSVFDADLVNNGGYSLWLEYVEDYKYGVKDIFWLMWYDVNGAPTIPLSGVFNLDQLRSMNAQLAAFITVP